MQNKTKQNPDKKTWSFSLRFDKQQIKYAFRSESILYIQKQDKRNGCI